MNAATLNPPIKVSYLLVSILVSIGVTLFLFYIDEGYYDLRWMKDARNWLWFVVYAGSFVAGQSLTKKYLLDESDNFFASGAVRFAGLIVGLVLCLLFIYGLAALFKLF
jgi:hypothetical protein